MTEYCAVIGTHSAVQGDKLLYGHVRDPFPWCGIGSGHTRLQFSMETLYNDQSATDEIMELQ